MFIFSSFGLSIDFQLYQAAVSSTSVLLLAEFQPQLDWKIEFDN